MYFNEYFLLGIMCDHGHGGCSHEAGSDMPLVEDIVMRYDMQQYIDKDKVTI